jgi:adenosylcobinamide-phosphate synthase
MTAFGAHDPLLLLLGGIAIDALFGDMRPLFRIVPHPIAFAGRAIGFFDRKLNRPQRSERDRRLRGVIAVMLLVGAAAALGWLVDRACRGSTVGGIVEAFAIGILLAQRSLFQHVASVMMALMLGGLPAGRRAISHIVGRNPESLDEHGVARAAIESLAENFSDGVVAPSFWFLVAGLPGLFAYKIANTLDSMIGHTSPRYRAFGWAAARCDDLLNLVPAPLSGILLVAAAFFAAGADPDRAWRIMRRDARKHRSPNAGWPEGAMAGALDLALAGPRDYPDGPVYDSWLGDGTPWARPADIARALRLYTLAALLGSGLLLGVSIAAHLTRPG